MTGTRVAAPTIQWWFRDLADAHHALTKALAERPDSFAEIYAAMETLSKDAEKLYKIAKAFRTAASGGGETGGS